MIKFIKSRIRWGFESPSQGQELRDTQQEYCQKTKAKSAENEDDQHQPHKCALSNQTLGI